jgi:hypothetical protein
VLVEYAKASPDDVLARFTVSNRAPGAATVHLLPTLWFRNTWSWGGSGENFPPRGEVVLAGTATFRASHTTLGSYTLVGETDGDAGIRLRSSPRTRRTSSACSACHRRRAREGRVPDYVVHARHDRVNPANREARRRCTTARRYPPGRPSSSAPPRRDR